MKKKIGLLVLVSVVIAACFSCGSDSSEHSKFDSMHRNETALDDSVYFGLCLYDLDTMAGFKEYFQDTLNHQAPNYYFRGLKESRDTSTNHLGIQLFERIFFKNYFLDILRNDIRLSQKAPILIKGRRDGTLSLIMLALREDGSFDVHSTSLFRNKLFEGTYTFKSDTLLLNFTTEKDEYLGDTLLLTEDRILTLNKSGSRWIDYYLVE